MRGKPIAKALRHLYTITTVHNRSLCIMADSRPPRSQFSKLPRLSLLDPEPARPIMELRNTEQGRAENPMAQPQRSGTDDLERIVLSNINEFGWHAVNVIEDDGHPPWSYTIGFHETWNFPELIVIGRSRATAHHILNTVAIGLEQIRSPDLKSPPSICSPDPPAASSKLRRATMPTTSVSPAGTTSASPFRSTKSSGPETTATTPGIQTRANPSKHGNPS